MRHLTEIIQLALICLLLSACTTGYTRFAVSPDASNEDFAVIQRAADRWNQCGLVEIVVRRGYAEPRYELPIEPVADIPGAWSGETHWDSNLSGRFPVWIHYESNIPLAQKEVVLTHELGHGLGIHDHTPTGIMSAVIAIGDPTVTPSDCQALAGTSTL